MSGQLTQFGANRGVQVGVGKGLAAAAAMYLALATAEAAGPDTATLEDFAANELTTAGYSRQPVTWNTPSGDPSQVPNDSAITFGTFMADPPNVTHCFLTDTSIGTVGNVMAYWTFTTPRDANSGDTLVVGIGDLTMSVD
jgi:hypothetical protein